LLFENYGQEVGEVFQVPTVVAM